MKGKKDLITILNSHLANELTTINQHMIYNEMRVNWAYAKLYLAIHGQAMDEMQHAEWLIECTNIHEGAHKNHLMIGDSASEMISKNVEAKLNAVTSYNNTIKLVRELYDKGTVDLLSNNVNSDEVHENWNQIQASQIDQMGMENYLSNQKCT